MNTKKVKQIMLTVALGSLIITGCRKNDSDEMSSADTITPQNIEQNESAGSDAENITDQTAQLRTTTTGETPQTVIATCVAVTHDTVSNPHTIIIDFGTTNCLCKDGRYRRGIINVSYTGNYFDTGSQRTITFSNYYVSDNLVEGTRVVTNSGLNAAGNIYWTVQATNMKITRPDGTFHTWSSTRTREMIAGYGTQTVFDDVHSITGSFNGTDASGNAFVANITAPLQRQIGCHWIVSGTMEILKTGKPLKTLDFGNGACDSTATVTVNGQTRTITLH
jgi:hypothetical protein